MPGLLRDLSHRPHGLLEVAHGDTCHVRATVLPPRINLPTLQELLGTFCRRGWPMVRCIGMHNGVALTDELRNCTPGFFVQIFVAGVVPAHAMEITRWCAEAGRLVHLDYQAYSSDLHHFTVMALLCWRAVLRSAGAMWPRGMNGSPLRCAPGTCHCVDVILIFIMSTHRYTTWRHSMTLTKLQWQKSSIWMGTTMKELSGVRRWFPVRGCLNSWA